MESMRSRFGWKKGWWPHVHLGWPLSDRSTSTAEGPGSPVDDLPDDD